MQSAVLSLPMFIRIHKFTVDTFTKEVNLFCAGRLQKTQTINELHKALLTIPPTSVEAERVFQQVDYSPPNYGLN